MQNIILLLIFNSLAILGLHYTTRGGQILYFLTHVANKVLGLDGWHAQLKKPLLDCPTCMASIWGVPVAGALLIKYPSWGMAVIAIVYVFALAGLNTLLSSIADRV